MASAGCDPVEAALAYAADRHPVLPLHSPAGGGCSCSDPGCESVGKHPRGGFGIYSATTDPAWIDAWFTVWPRSNLGVRTDGVWALDVDGEPGEQSRERLEHRLGPLPRTRRQQTSSADRCHLLFSLPHGVTGSNSTASLGAPRGLDVRSGAGGYIVVDPSVHHTGARYRMDDHPLTPLPGAWVERIASRASVAAPAAPTLPPSWQRLSTSDSRYGRAALRSELDRLRGCQAGGRHGHLNVSAYRLAQLVAAGELTVATVHRAWSTPACGTASRSARSSGSSARRSRPGSAHRGVSNLDALCHLCQRPFPAETMLLDAGGDRWCFDDGCHAIALDRLRNPKSPYRRRRELARLEYQYGPPVDPMTLFAVPTAAEIFALDTPKPDTAPPRLAGVVQPPRVLGEQLGLFGEEAA